MSRLPLVLALVALNACQDDHKQAAPTAPVTASASASTMPTDKPASKPGPKAPVPSAPAELTSLPAGAMVYGRLDITPFQVAFDLVPAGEKDKTVSALEKLTGTKIASASAFATALGIDVSRPVVFAAVGPKAAPMEALAADMAKVRTEKDRDAVYAKWDALEPPPVILGRIMVPLGQGGPAKLLAALGDAGGGKVVPCPKAEECAQLPGAKQLLKGRGELAAVYMGEGALVIDGVSSYREQARASAIKALAAFRTQRGGPGEIAGQSICRELQQTPGTAICLVGPPAAEAGVATGLGMLMRAVDGSVAMGTVVEMTKRGTEEALQVRAIAAKKPDFLDDGTFALARSKGNSVTTEGSWRVHEDGIPKLAAYKKEACAKGSTDVQAALDKLGTALGVADGDPKALGQQFREAGWAGLVVAMEGAWPAYLPVTKQAMKDMPAGVEVCVVLDGRRLKVRTTFDPTTLIQP